jgi:hypothetical protein
MFSDDWRFEYYFWKFILLISEFFAFILFLKMIEVKDYLYPFIYCILPLSTIEIAGQGHNDGLLFVFLALLMYYLMTDPTPALPTRDGEKANIFLKPSLVGRVWIGSELKSTRLHKFWMEIKSCLFIGLQIAFLTLIKIIPFTFIALIVKMKIIPLNKAVILFSSLIVILVFSMPFIFDYRAIEIFRSGQQYYNISASFNSLALIISRFILELFNIKDWWIVAPYIVQFLRILALAVTFLLIKPIDKNSTINGFILFYLIPILISSKVHTWYFAPLVLLSLYNKNFALAFALQIFLFSYQYYLFIDKSIVPYLDVVVWLFVSISFLMISKLQNRQLESRISV